MSYKTERGNVAKKSLRFHATAKIALDYQLVTKHPVAASRLGETLPAYGAPVLRLVATPRSVVWRFLRLRDRCSRRWSG